MPHRFATGRRARMIASLVGVRARVAPFADAATAGAGTTPATGHDVSRWRLA